MKKTLFIIALVFSLGATMVLAQQQDEPVCGDSILQPPEKCDTGGDSDSCTDDCGQKLLGWAWASNSGWLSLNDDNCRAQYLDEDLNPSICAQNSQNYFVQVTKTDEVTGYAWSDNLGWICFGSFCSGQGTPPSGTIEARLDYDDPQNPQVFGWAKIIRLNNDGWVSLNCTNDSCSTSDYRVRVVESEFNGESRLSLQGFAWNPKIGWIQFAPSLGSLPWLQTQYGDIYARRGIEGNEPRGFNATYRILSSGAIVNFHSSQGADPFWVQPNAGSFDFPSPATQYSNVLGKLELSRLVCQFNGSDSCMNQLGRRVYDLSKISLTPTRLLNGDIYLANGDFTVNNPVEFLNGTGFKNGSGTIIVNGDLQINANVTYDDAGSPSNFRNLSSVSWIVIGDLRIAGNVEQVAGTFIVLGDGNECSATNEVPGCGQIYSCSSGNCDNKRLSVSGLMIGRKFYLRRTYSNPLEVPQKGSEIIINDGRLLANTPPGIGDFAQSLPVWRSEVFSQ